MGGGLIKWPRFAESFDRHEPIDGTDAGRQRSRMDLPIGRLPGTNCSTRAPRSKVRHGHRTGGANKGTP